jgi:hypothetical protein
LSSISCAAVRSCTAVGEYAPGYPYASDGIVMRESGREWIVSQAPEPSSQPVGNESFNAIVCISHGCEASGSYAVPVQPSLALFLAESSKISKTVKAPGVTDVSVRSLSCASFGACSAVGYGEVWVESKGRWAASPAPLPSNGGGGPAMLAAISCSSATTCTAVGDYEEPVTEIANPLVETTR